MLFLTTYQQWCWTFWGWGWLDRSVGGRRSHWKKNKRCKRHARTEAVLLIKYTSIFFSNMNCLLFTSQLSSSWWCWWAISAAQTSVGSHRWTLTSCSCHQRGWVSLWTHVFRLKQLVKIILPRTMVKVNVQHACVCSYGGRISAAMKIFSTSSDRMLRRWARFRFTSSFFSSLDGFSFKDAKVEQRLTFWCKVQISAFLVCLVLTLFSCFNPKSNRWCTDKIFSKYVWSLDKF